MAMEGLPLHFTLFSKIWSEIYNKSHEVLSTKQMKLKQFHPSLMYRSKENKLLLLTLFICFQKQDCLVSDIPDFFST